MASNRKDIPQPTGSVDPRNRKPVSKPNPPSFIGPPKPPGYVRPNKSNDSKPQPTGAVVPENKPTNKSKNKSVQNNKYYGAPEPTGTVDPRNRAHTPKTLNPSNPSNPSNSSNPEHRDTVKQSEIDSAKTVTKVNQTDEVYYHGNLPFLTKNETISKNKYKWYPTSTTTNIQEFLNYYFFESPKFSVPVDGYYGDSTEATVKQFQREKGLPETGVIDSITLEAMRNTTFSLQYRKRYVQSEEEQIYNEYFDGKKPGAHDLFLNSYPGQVIDSKNPTAQKDYLSNISVKAQRKQVLGLIALRDLYDKYNIPWDNPNSPDYNSTLYYYFKDHADYSGSKQYPIKNNLHPDPENQVTPGVDAEGFNTYGYGALERHYLIDCYKAGILDASTTKVVEGENLTPEYKKRLINSFQKRWGIDILRNEWTGEYNAKNNSSIPNGLFKDSIYVSDPHVIDNITNNAVEVGVYNGTTILRAKDGKYYAQYYETDKEGQSDIQKTIELPNLKYTPKSKVKVIFKSSADADTVLTDYKLDKSNELIATVIIPDNYTDKQKAILENSIKAQYNYNSFVAHINKIYEAIPWIAQQRANAQKSPKSFLTAAWISGAGTGTDEYGNEHTWEGDVVYTDNVHLSILDCFSEAVKLGDKEAYMKAMKKSGLDPKSIDYMWDVECNAYKDYLSVFEGEPEQETRSNPFSAHGYYDYKLPIENSDSAVGVVGNTSVALVSEVAESLDILAKPMKVTVGGLVYDLTGTNILNVSNDVIRDTAKLLETDMLSYDINKDASWDEPANLALEIVLDPLNWLTFGYGAIAQSASKGIVKPILKEASEQILKESPEILMQKLGKEATEDIVQTALIKTLKETSSETLEESLGKLLKGSDSVTKAAIASITQDLDHGAYRTAARQIISNSDELTQRLFKTGLEEILESKQLTNFYTDLVKDMRKASSTSPYKIFGKNKTTSDFFQEAYHKTFRKYSGNTSVQHILADYFGKTTKLSPGAQKVAAYSLESSNKKIIQENAKHSLKFLTVLTRSSETVQKVLATTLFSALSQGLIPAGWLLGKGYKALSNFTNRHALVNNVVQKLSDISKENKTINIFDLTPDITAKHTISMSKYSDSLLEGDHLSTDFFLRNIEESINIDLHKMDEIIRKNYKNPTKCNEALCAYLKIAPTKSLEETLTIYKARLDNFLKDPNYIGLSGEALAKSDSFNAYLEAVAKGETPSEDLGNLYARYVTDDGSEQLLKVNLSGEFRRIEGELYYALADSKQLIHSAELVWSPVENYINIARKDIDKFFLEATSKMTLQQTYTDAIAVLNRVQQLPINQEFVSLTEPLINNSTALGEIKEAIASLNGLLGNQAVLDTLPKQDQLFLDRLLKSLGEVENNLEAHIMFQKQLMCTLQGHSVFDMVKMYAEELKLKDQLSGIQRIEKAISTGESLEKPIEEIQQEYAQALDKAILEHNEAFTNTLNKNISRIKEFSEYMRDYVKSFTESPYKPVADSFVDYHRKVVKYPQTIASEKMDAIKVSDTVKEILENVESLDASTLKRELTAENMLQPYKRFGKVKYQENIKFIESFTFADEGLQKIKQNFVDILKRKNFTKTPEAFEEYSNIWHSTCRELSSAGTKIDAKNVEDYTKLLNLLNQYNPDRFIKNTITVHSEGIIRQLKLADVFIASQYFSAPSLQKTLDFVSGDSYFSRFLNSLSNGFSKKTWTKDSPKYFHKALNAILSDNEVALINNMEGMVLTAVALKESSKGYKDSLRLLNALADNNKLSKETVNAFTETLLKFSENSLDSVTFNYPNFLQKVFDNIDAYNTFKYQTDFYTPNSYINNAAVLDNFKKVFGEYALENLTGLQKDMAILESVMNTLLFKEFNGPASRYIIADLETSAVKGNTSGALYEISYKSRGGDFVTLKRRINTKFIEDPVTGKPIKVAVNPADAPSTAYISSHYKGMSIEEGYQKFYETYSTGDYNSEEELITAFTDDMIRNVGEQNTKLVFQNSDKFNMQFLHQKCYDLGIDDAFLTGLEKCDIRQMLAAKDGIKLLTPSEKETIHQLLSAYLESRKTSTVLYNKLIDLDENTFKYAIDQFGCSKFFMIPDERFADNLMRMCGQLETVETEYPVKLVTQTRTILKNSADEIYNTSHNITQMSSVLNKYLFEDTLKNPKSTLYNTLKENFNKYLDANSARLEVQFGMSIDQIKRKYGEAINFTKVLTGLEDDTATLAFRNIADFEANLALFKKLKKGMSIQIEDMIRLNDYTNWVANNSERLFNIFNTNSPDLIKNIAESRDSIVEAINRMQALLKYSDKSNAVIYNFLDPSTLTDKELLAVYTKQLSTIRETLFEIIESPGSLTSLINPEAIKIMPPESQELYTRILEILTESGSIFESSINELTEFGVKLKDTPDEGLFLSKLLFDDTSSDTFEMLEFSQKGYTPIIRLCDMDDWSVITQKIMNPESTWHKNLDALEELDETGFFSTQQQVFAESLRSTQKMIRIVEAIFSPTKATKRARILQNSFVQAQELVYKAIVTHRLQMPTDELKSLMVYQAPWFEISKADITTSPEAYKAYNNFLARKTELNAAGIVFEESGGRLYVALTDLEDISYSINRDTGKLEAYKEDMLIAEPPRTKFSYSEALQLKSKPVAIKIDESALLNSFCNYWDEAEKSLEHMSQGACIGSVGDHMTKETMEMLYEQLPESIKAIIPSDKIFDDLLWGHPRFNFTNLGSSASRRLKNPQSSTSLITSLVRSSEHAVARAPAILQYTNMFFDKALRLDNELSVFSKVSNKEIYNYFKNNPEFSLAVLFKSKKAELGCKVVPIRVNSVADIKLAKELGAVVISTNTLSKAMDSINNNLFSDGFLEYYKRALYVYKVGYLINPGTALRNFEDGILKNSQELGITDTLRYTAIASDLVKKYNAATEELIKLGDGKFAKDILPYYFGNINKEMSLETYQMLHMFFQDPSSSGMTKVWSKYYADLNAYTTRTAWEVFSEGISKALDPMAQVERINRLTLFLGLADQGYTNLEIFRTITKAHFDYATKSTGTQLLEMFIPFYTFTANNLTYWVNYFTEHPSILRNYFKAYTKMWNIEDIEDSKYNPSLEYQILNGNTKLGNNIVLKTNFSFMNAFNLLVNPVKTMKGSLFEPWEGVADLILDSANITNPDLRSFLGMEDVYESSKFRQTINNFVANNDKEGYINYCKYCGIDPNTISQNWEIEKKNYKWNQTVSEDHWYNNSIVKYIPGINTLATRIAQASKYYAYTDNPIIPLASDIFGMYKSMPEYTFGLREKQMKLWGMGFSNWKRYDTKKSTWKDFSTSERARYYAKSGYSKKSYSKKSYIKKNKKRYIKRSYAKRSYAKKTYSNLPYFYSRVYTPHKYTISKGLGLNINSNRFTRKYYNKDGTSKMENRKKTYTPKYLRYRIQDWKYYYNH